MLQAMAYTLSQVADPDGDDDELRKKMKSMDTPFMWMNESGKKFQADITPLLRVHPWYQGEPTGARRSYVHFGKQAMEVLGWLTDPWKNFTGKLSSPTRMIVEEFTGEKIGIAWDLGFKGQDFIPSIMFGKEGMFYDGSRMQHILQTFKPFSASALDRPELLPLNLGIPVSKGINFNNASSAYYQILSAWANKKSYSAMYTRKDIQTNLEDLGRDLLDGAERNGYDSKKIMESARAAVMKDLHAQMYKAISDQDAERVEEVARAMGRVNGTLAAALKSAKARNKMYGKDVSITEDQRAMLLEAFKNP